MREWPIAQEEVEFGVVPLSVSVRESFPMDQSQSHCFQLNPQQSLVRESRKSLNRIVIIIEGCMKQRFGFWEQSLGTISVDRHRFLDPRSDIER